MSQFLVRRLVTCRCLMNRKPIIPLIKKRRRRPKQRSIVFGIPKNQVAISVDQPPHTLAARLFPRTARPVVIHTNGERVLALFEHGLMANSAQTILSLPKGFEIDVVPSSIHDGLELLGVS